VKKKPIKPIKILKKPTGSVRFWFFKPGTKKTEPDPNRKEPSQTGLNRFLLYKTEPNRTKTGRFEPVSVFFLKKSVWLFFLIKTEPNRK
jgi:hypothetical protein